MRPIFALLPVAALALSACQPQSADVYVEKSWVRLSAVPGQPAAAYFRLKGGNVDDTMFAVHADQAIKAEMHETMQGMKGMSEMKPLDTLLVPARAKLEFAPGGKHVMLFGLGEDVKPGGSITLTFVFKSGLKLQDNAVVVGAGDAAPKLP